MMNSDAGPMPGGMGQPSPEELMSMLEQMQAAGHNLEEISPDLSELLRNVKKKAGEKTDDTPMEEIEPEPGFVVKTVDTNTGTKVFINVCSHDHVPAPGSGWSNGVVPEEVQTALATRDDMGDGADMESLRFPLSAGQPKTDYDKKGERCVTVDCILNSDVVKQAANFRPLKAFLCELCIGWVAQKSKMALDEKFKLPKMRYKGEMIEKQNIRVDRKPLVCEVKDVPDEPTFPLVTKKVDKEKAAAKQAAKAAPAKPSASVGAGGSGGDGDGRSAVPRATSAVPSASHFNFSGKQVMTHRMEYVGRPVTGVVLTVSVPPAPDAGTASPSEVPGRDVGVELAARSVHVTAPGAYDLTVALPFAVTAGTTGDEGSGGGGGGEHGEAAEYDASSGTLTVRLRYAGLDSLLARARDEKPLPLGQLGLGTEGLLELEP